LIEIFDYSSIAIDTNGDLGRSSSLPLLNKLQSEGSRRRINQIDKIRAYGIGDIVSLPQLVVCGDQSVGKISVLEGITGIPFPRKDGLCTRFPTEIILRRDDAEKSIMASIQPHSSRSTDGRASLAAYKKTMTDIMSELPGVTEEVSAKLQLRGGPGVVDGSAFASDVLRIEITAHTDLNLTVVDLPGLISLSNDEQIETDVQVIRNMVEGYIESSRTIILAIIQAGNDIANQSIVQMARKHDPEWQRTLGIITKPDLINKGTEGRIAALAMNQGNVKLEHGFFLLKNPTPAEIDAGITTEQRLHTELEFFSSSTWRSHGLDMGRVGVENLRLFLQDLLDNHIERELPNVVEEIRKRLIETEDSLKLLGEPRSGIPAIRGWLTSISMDFCQLVQAASNGDYQGVQSVHFDPSSNFRLRATIQKLNTTFASDVTQKGQKRTVKASKQADPKASENTEEYTEEYTDGVFDWKTGQSDGGHPLVTKKAMAKWVKSVYQRTKGRELPGDYNYVLLAELFREQSSPWGSMAQHHVVAVLSHVKKWIVTAITKTVPDEKLRREVAIICNSWIDGTRDRALAKLQKLLDDESRQPITYNHYYTDNIQKAREDALGAKVEEALKFACTWGSIHDGIQSHQEQYKQLSDSLKSRITVDMDEQACSESMIALNAYYKVAMKTFVDNVCRQVIERHILARLPDMFCPATIAEFSDEKLKLIGLEPKSRQQKRDSLSTRKVILKASLVELQLG
ncbi:Interferon-induced GTP-binding protein Mx, partial [Apiospora sp. TS-2023a]